MEVGRDHLSWVLLSSGGETLSLALSDESEDGPLFAEHWRTDLFSNAVSMYWENTVRGLFRKL